MPSTIDIQIVREKHNLPVVFDFFVPILAKQALATTYSQAYATCISMHSFFSMTTI
jgi:hypothetical protein